MSERPWLSSAPFVLTVAVSSATLFMLQPMCARIILPYLGGSSSVWTTCMLFFQVGLLGGYLYAHAAARLGHRVQAGLHVVLVALACAFLPPLDGRPLNPGASEESPVPWLLGTLIGEIGLPYLVLASSAPLLQVWFARAPSSGQRDPYPLYAASNAGSLLGLLAYPFLIEPTLTLGQQSSAWSASFLLFALLTTACAAMLWRSGVPGVQPERAPSRRGGAAGADVPAVALGQLVKWLFLAFLPSSLLLSVTTHLSLDVAAIPFLWVLPLAIYLVTYIVAFSSRGLGWQRVWMRWLPLVVLVLVIVLLTDATEPLLLILVLHVVGLFWIAMACHAELARSRPPVKHLTTFYLCIALGGALGGGFNALLAPVIFSGLVEYPLALVLACFVPALARQSEAESGDDPRRQWKLDVIGPALLAILTAVLVYTVARTGVATGRASIGLAFGVPLIICYLFSNRPLRFGLGIAALLIVHALQPGKDRDQLVRSFYGVHRLRQSGDFRILIHGTTEHGRQNMRDPSLRAEPLSYYSRSGPMGDLFGALGMTDSRRRSVAVLGLGAGTMAAYARSGDHWTFYEIDPSVVRIARSEFAYLADAEARGAKIEIVLGDARVQLSRTKGEYGVIVLDVFSSDSIPTHLFTRQALEVYRSRLSQDGVLALHFSSRYFALAPVLAGLAASAQPPLLALARDDVWMSTRDWAKGKSPSKWAVFLPTLSEPLARELIDLDWTQMAADPSVRPWTDDFANILASLEHGEDDE